MRKQNASDNLACDFSKESFSSSEASSGEKPAAQFKATRKKLRLEQWLSAFFVMILFLILFVPLTQLAFEPIPRRSVSGLRAPDHSPKLSFAGFLKQSFQSNAEEWFLKRHGLWGYLVRANNEISYRLFSQVSANYNSTILVGHDKQLFQPMYLKSLNKIHVPKMRKIRKRARQVKKFQALLKKRGIASTLVFSANLLSQYPELIPKAYIDPTRHQRKNSYEIMRPLLDELNINYIDGHQLLNTLKPSYPFRLFQSTASHWNDIASCHVTSSLTNHLGALMGKSLRTINCAPYQFANVPHDYDRDLLAVANLFFPKKAYRPAPYVQPVIDEGQPIFQPKLLIVGTSFSFSLLDQLRRFNVTNQAKLYFYYNHIKDISGRSRALDRKQINWKNDVFSNDAIILEITTAGAGIAGFKFLITALNRLKRFDKSGKTKKKQSVKRKESPKRHSRDAEQLPFGLSFKDS